MEGWILRFSNGYTKRANAAQALYEFDETTLLEKVKRIEKVYEKENEQVIFKVFSDFKYDLLEELLELHNYTREGHVNVQIAELRDMVPILKPNTILQMDGVCTDRWFESFTAFNQLSAEDAATCREMLELIMPDTGYFLLIDEEKDVVLACGLGVLEENYVGLFDIVTNPAHRGNGYGEQLVVSILNWGLRNKATHAYLQVLSNNHPALTLYEKLGFDTAYDYWFRIKQTGRR